MRWGKSSNSGIIARTLLVYHWLTAVKECEWEPDAARSMVSVEWILKG